MFERCVCAQGNLKQYLASAGDGLSGLRPPSTAERLSMCRGVVLAMKHVAGMRLAHGDLAARNMLVSSGLDVKLTCASLCLDVFARDYIVHRRRPLPLRWAAPEAVAAGFDRATPAADVWSFGVLVWELFTPHCPLPLSDRSDADVLAWLQALASPATAGQSCIGCGLLLQLKCGLCVVWELFTPHCPLPLNDRSDADVLAWLQALASPATAGQSCIGCGLLLQL